MYRALSISGPKEREMQGLVAELHSISLTAGQKSLLTHQLQLILILKANLDRHRDAANEWFSSQCHLSLSSAMQYL